MNLPLLEYCKTLCKNPRLDKVCIIAAQHLLGTTRTMFHTLFDLGLQPDNVFLIGKCYSTSSEVFSELRQDGINVSPLSYAFDNHQVFDDQYRSYLSSFFYESRPKIESRDIEKIVVLDDGGHLILEAQNQFGREKQVIGVEQTTSGVEALSKMKLTIPVVNVARSQAKLMHESPEIVRTALQETSKRLARLEHRAQRILIIGGGAIGGALANILDHAHSVDLYDINPFRTLISEHEMIRRLPEYDLIFGCTGLSAFSSGWISRLKPGAALISMSSSDREFPALHFRNQQPKGYNCHEDITHNQVTLLNSGFPVNFNGERHSVPPSFIQLTRALLLVAILQATTFDSRSPEWINLDGEYQNDIVRRYKSIIGGLPIKALSTNQEASHRLSTKNEYSLGRRMK